jgi:hypothetical protein
VHAVCAQTTPVRRRITSVVRGPSATGRMPANPPIKRRTAHPRQSTTHSVRGLRGPPIARDKISAIVKSRRLRTSRSVPTSLKNGAPSPMRRFGGGSMEPGLIDVRSGRTVVCDRAPSAPSTAKWRFRPSQKRHFAPFFTTFLMIFSGFFFEPARQGAK